MISSKGRGVFMRIAIVLALSIVGFTLLVFAISQKMATDGAEVRGLATDYNELAATPVIGDRISYFPRAAKSIEYWCRPYNSGIYGSFDIGETDYLDWAHAMGWQLRELGPIELEPTILVRHPDGSEEYLDRPEKCFFFKHQVFKKPRVLDRDFQIVYNKTTKRAYIADSDGRAGPPNGDAGAKEDR